MSDLPNGKALAKAFLADQDDLYAVNQRVCALTPYRDSSKYLFYVLNRNPYFLKFDDGVNQTHLLNRVFQKCSLSLPPTKAEQESIAEALSHADALIESLEQLLAKKRHLKQGAVQELLTGKKRLPGFSRQWALRPLVEMVKAEKFAIVDGPFGTQMKVEEYVSEGVPVIEMEHLNDSVITKRLERCITPKKFEQLKRSAVYPGDIVISKTGSLGYLARIIHEAHE